MNPTHKLIAEAIKEEIDKVKSSNLDTTEKDLIIFAIKTIVYKQADIYEEEEIKEAIKTRACFVKDRVIEEAKRNKTQFLKIATGEKE